MLPSLPENLIGSSIFIKVFGNTLLMSSNIIKNSVDSTNINGLIQDKMYVNEMKLILILSDFIYFRLVEEFYQTMVV